MSFSDRKKPFRNRIIISDRISSFFTIQSDVRKISNTKKTRWKRDSGYVYFAKPESYDGKVFMLNQEHEAKQHSEMLKK